MEEGVKAERLTHHRQWWMSRTLEGKSGSYEYRLIQKSWRQNLRDKNVSKHVSTADKTKQNLDGLLKRMSLCPFPHSEVLQSFLIVWNQGRKLLNMTKTPFKIIPSSHVHITSKLRTMPPAPVPSHTGFDERAHSKSNKVRIMWCTYSYTASITVHAIATE